MAGTHQRDDTVLSAERPIAVLGGFFIACASTAFTIGAYWIFAPVFILIVVAIGWFSGRNGNTAFARGAFAALIWVLVFGGCVLVLSLLT